MKLKDVIRLDKEVVDYGKWSNGDIERSSWPMRKKRLKQSNDWRWRVIQLDAEGQQCRVLLKFNPLIETFHAILAVVRGEELAILCSHDLHTVRRRIS